MLPELGQNPVSEVHRGPSRGWAGRATTRS